jgi:L-ascorbate metabolism protein UlaG (beta-lactamase superfamily)
MDINSLSITYIGGPTALLEIAGLRFLTDPTFDPARSEYTTAVYTLRKMIDPAIGADAVGPIDAVLLSHDHHFDTLDRAGRALLPSATQVLTTKAGAERLGGNAIGLANWESVDIAAPNGERLRVTGTPARHGPADGDRGPVSGFLITDASQPENSTTPAIYVSGDTVWYDGLRPIQSRADVKVALLFLGAAKVREVGPAHLTFAASEGVEAAKAFPNAAIVPLHYAGWGHFSEGKAEIQRAFDEAGIGNRLHWLIPGRRSVVSAFRSA